MVIELSRKIMIKRGVPQGSCLGPLLYNVGTDLSNHEELLNSTVKFADDICLVAHGKSINEVEAKLKSDYSTVKNQLKSRGLVFNISKFQLILIGPGRRKVPKSYTIDLDGTSVPRSSEITVLGVVLDEGLSYHSHTGKLLMHTKRKLNNLIRTCSHLPAQCRNLASQTLILSNLMYGDAVWAIYGQKTSEDLLRIQRKAARWALWGIKGVQREADSHKSRPVCVSQLGWLPVTVNHKLNFAKRVWKSVRLGLSLPAPLRFNSEGTEEGASRSWAARAARVWRSLPMQVKTCNNPQDFKTTYMIAAV